jgi:putative transposase
MKKLDSKKLKAFRYRICPNKEQQTLFVKTFGCARLVYNKMLSEKIEALNKEKARRKLAKQHEYVANLRNDFLHKLSKAIVDENQVIVVEDLNVKGMQQNPYLSKSISDSGFGKFLRYLEYKADWYERTLVVVDRFYPSSKLCNVCGYKHKQLKLSNKYWTCPECGIHHNRDINASINLYKVGLERSKVTPAEHALVNDRTQQWVPKKPSCYETESLTFYKAGQFTHKLRDNINNLLYI